MACMKSPLEHDSSFLELKATMYTVVCKVSMYIVSRRMMPESMQTCPGPVIPAQHLQL